jgi:hypothetical protein
MSDIKTEVQGNIKYSLGRDGRTVTAIVTVQPDSIIGEMGSILVKSSVPIFIATEFDVNPSVMLINDTYIGKATCHPDDEFDWEIGKRYAKLRALKAYYRDRKKVFDRISKIYDDAARRMRSAADHNDFSLKHIDDYIAEM